MNNDIDDLPDDSGETGDLDRDGIGDNSDPDIDGDGVTGKTSDGSRVARWTDKSGLDNHVAQESTERRPTLRRDAIGGKPTLRFDGGDCLELAKAAGLDAGDQAFHAVFVMVQ